MIKKIIISILLVSLYPITIMSQETQSSLYYSLGSKLMKDKNYEEALKNFQLSIKYNEPKIKSSIIEACACQNIMENYQEAINYGKKALQYDLEDMEKGRVYLLIGNSYGFLGNYKTAFNYFELMKQSASIYNIPDEFIFIKEGWFYLAQSKYDYIYYNKNSIKKNAKGKIKVWLKWYWNEKSLSEEDLEKTYKSENFIEAFNQRINEIMEERENASYTLYYEEYDFNNNCTRLLQSIKYDKEGKVLKSYNYENNGKDKTESTWNNIVPNSVGEKIFNTLKKQYN